MIISGQKNAGEVVTHASAFLHMEYLYITPVSTNLHVSDDFDVPISIYLKRDYSVRYHNPGYHKKLVLPDDNLSNMGLFWLAIDKEGYSIARQIVSRNNLSPDEKIHNTVLRVNLITPEISPCPNIIASSRFWLKIRSALYQAEQKYPGRKSKEGRKKIFEKHVPISSIEKGFFSWYKLLHERLEPWKKTIKNIIIDMS